METKWLFKSDDKKKFLLFNIRYRHIEIGFPMVDELGFVWFS
jgi:hypothetical protein